MCILNVRRSTVDAVDHFLAPVALPAPEARLGRKTWALGGSSAQTGSLQ